VHTTRRPLLSSRATARQYCYEERERGENGSYFAARKAEKKTIYEEDKRIKLQKKI
jgi:hypothetical protein